MTQDGVSDRKIYWSQVSWHYTSLYLMATCSASAESSTLTRDTARLCSFIQSDNDLPVCPICDCEQSLQLILSVQFCSVSSPVPVYERFP